MHDDGLYPALDRIADDRYVTVQAGNQDLIVTCVHSDPDRQLDAEGIVALLPRVRSLLADFAAIRERATAYLWDFGATGDETDEERADFLRETVPTTLVVADPRTAELHYENISEKYMLDGYWPAVHFDEAMIPVEVTVEA